MLTFDSIRELERNEKAGKKLQKLPDGFMSDLRDYLRRKEQAGPGAQEFENIKNTVKRLFELRETKLTEMALVAARTGLLPGNMTKEEEDAFSRLVDVLKQGRARFFSEMDKEPRKEARAPEKEKRIIYKVKKSVQEFVGPDMKIYRLSAGEIVNLPKPLNDLLLKEGVIEEIRE